MRKLATNLVYYYLRFWAKIALSFHKPKIIGITGSVGKSTTRNAVYALLRDNFSVKMIHKGNSETGIPLGILGLDPVDYSFLDWARLLLLCPFKLNYLGSVEYLVIEMAIDDPDYPKNMAYLLTIVKPDIAVFLNVHPVHTMQFDKTVPTEVTGDERLGKILANIAHEKAKIITQSGCKTGVYNRDNRFIKNELESKSDINLMTFGKNADNDISYGQYKISTSGTEFDFSIGKELVKIHFRDYLLPEENRELFAAALLVGKSLGMKSDAMSPALEKNFYLPPGRAGVFPGIKDSLIIDSSYNASKVSVIAFLSLLKKLKDHEGRKTVFVFGDMRELGDEEQAEHEAIVPHIAAAVDYLYCVGPLAKKYILPKIHGLEAVKWFPDSFEAGNYLAEHLPDHALVLVKGSQNTIFLEEAIKPILKNKEDGKKLPRQADFWLKRKHQS